MHIAGPHPERLARLLPFTDWVGFDVWAPFAGYVAITGVPESGERARTSLIALAKSDIAFEAHRVAIEIDGKVHLWDAKKFEGDRYRQNALLLDGWLVLRFTWRMLTENPDYVVQMTRQALELRDRNPPRPGLR